MEGATKGKKEKQTEVQREGAEKWGGKMRKKGEGFMDVRKVKGEDLKVGKEKQ